MRCFFAIELDEITREILVKEQNRLKSKAIRANFTRRDNLHLTLRFMGEIAPAYFPVLKKISDFVAARSHSFELALSKPGAFVRGHKSIIWWGIRHNDQLDTLQNSLEREIQQNGFPGEFKPYTPHITLAREFVSNLDTKRLMQESNPFDHSFIANRISLMESTRIDGKLTYICRYSSVLPGDAL